MTNKSFRHIVKYTGLTKGYLLIIGLQFSIFILIEMLVCALNFSLFFPPYFGNKFKIHYRTFFIRNWVLRFYYQDIGHEPILPPPISFGNPIERTASPPKKIPQPIESFDILAAGLCCQIFCTMHAARLFQTQS